MMDLEGCFWRNQAETFGFLGTGGRHKLEGSIYSEGKEGS